MERLFRYGSYTALALGLASGAVFVVFAILNRFELVAWDTWRQMGWWTVEWSLPSMMFRQYETHRLPIVTLLMYLDQVYLNGRNLGVFIPVMSALVGTIAWCAHRLRAEVGDADVLRYTIAALITLCLSLTSSDAIVHAFRAWVPLSLILALLTMAAFARAVLSTPGRVRPTALALTAFLAVSCTYAGAPGLLIWPTLLLTGLVALGVTWRTMGCLMIVGALALGFFFFNLDLLIAKHSAHSPLQHLNSIVGFLGYLTTFIGVPAGNALFFAPFNVLAEESRIALGAVALLVFLVALAWALIQPVRRPAVLTALGIAIFTFGWACSTVLKHNAPPPQPWSPVLKSQDFIAARVFIAALITYLAMVMPTPAPRWLKGLFAVVALGLTVALLPLQVQNGFAESQRKQEVIIGGLAFSAGVFEDEHASHGAIHVASEPGPIGPLSYPGKKLHQSYEPLPHIWAFMMGRRIAPLDHPGNRYIGARFTDAFGDRPTDRCDGEFRGARSVIDGARVWGRLQGVDNLDDVRIVILDPTHRIVGVGQSFNRFTYRMQFKVPEYPAQGGWFGYVNPDKTEGLSAVVVDRQGQALCGFGAE